MDAEAKQGEQEQHQRIKIEPIVEDEITRRRRLTAERQRRFREVRRLERGMIKKEAPLSSTERVRRYRRRKKEESMQNSTASKRVQQLTESPGAEAERTANEDEVVFVQRASRKKVIERGGSASDPLQFVEVKHSTDWSESAMRTVGLHANEVGDIAFGGVDNSELESAQASNLYDVVHSTKNKEELLSRLGLYDRKASPGENHIYHESTVRGTEVSLISKIKIPSLRMHSSILKCVSSYEIRIAILNIDGQLGLPVATYNLLCTLTTGDLNITRDQFIRMWRSILLRRVQEVESRMRGTRAVDLIPLDYLELLVPAPLNDLLCCIGRFHSETTGVMHYTFAPSKLEKPADWWTLDEELVSLWSQTMNVFKNKFVMKKTPMATDYDNKPLMMTQIQITSGQMVQCKAKTNEIDITDGYVHMLNDPLYCESIYSFDECHIIVSSPINQDYLRSEYLSSYVLMNY